MFLGPDSPQPRLLLDAGNVAKGTSQYDRIKLGYILDGMWGMGYDAMNLGEREVALGRETLVQIAGTGRVPLVSSNVVDASTNRPLVAPFRIVRARGCRVAVLGVTDGPAGPGLAVLPVEPALAGLLPEIRKKADVIVLLASVDAARLETLASEFPQIQCIFGGAPGNSWETAEQIGRVLALSVGEEGKSVGRVRGTWTKGAGFRVTRSETIALEPEIAEHPAMQMVVEAYKRGVRTVAPSGVARPPGAGRYVGSTACRTCHAEAFRTWSGSKHAHALATIKRDGYQYDPECLTCHTTGYGAVDGYGDEARMPALAAVGCESCHERRSAHLENPSTGRRPTEQTCRKCHDESNSPKFDFDLYSERIRHW